MYQVNLTSYFYIAISLEKFVKLYQVNLTSYFHTTYKTRHYLRVKLVEDAEPCVRDIPHMACNWLLM